MYYPDNLINDIRTMLHSNKTYGQIANSLTAKYNKEFTRNQIIGKVWRLRRAGVSI